MSKTINLNLDTSKSDIQNPKILLRQGDGNYQTLRVTITSNGEPTDLTNADVVYLGTTSADHKIIDSNITKVDALNGVIDYRPPKQWGQDMGNFKNSYFEITTGDSTGSTASFKVSVLEAVDLNAEQAGDYITVVDGIVAVVRKELSDQLADVQAKTDNATGLVKQASDNLVAMAQNYNTDITNKYNDANAKANDVNQKLNSGYFASKNDENIFEKDNHFKGNLSVAGSLNATADNANHAKAADWAKVTPQANFADNAKHATTADWASVTPHANVADHADYLNPANNQTVQSITAKNWSTFQSGLESFSGFKSHGWANFEYVATTGDLDVAGHVKSNKQVNTSVTAPSGLVLNVMRVGNVVQINFTGTITSSIGWWGNVSATIPSGYRPMTPTIGFYRKGTGNVTAGIQIGTDGVVYNRETGFNVDGDGNDYFSGSMVYLTTDDFPY